jgi:hypothetical protein
MEEELFEPPRAPDQKGGQTIITETIGNCDDDNNSICMDMEFGDL